MTELAVLNIFISLFRLELYFTWFCCCRLYKYHISYLTKNVFLVELLPGFPLKISGAFHVVLLIKHLLCQHVVHFYVQTQIVVLGQPHVYFAGLPSVTSFSPFP